MGIQKEKSSKGSAARTEMLNKGRGYQNHYQTRPYTTHAHKYDPYEDYSATSYVSNSSRHQKDYPYEFHEEAKNSHKNGCKVNGFHKTSYSKDPIHKLNQSEIKYVVKKTERVDTPKLENSKDAEQKDATSLLMDDQVPSSKTETEISLDIAELRSILSGVYSKKKCSKFCPKIGPSTLCPAHLLPLPSFAVQK
eukprot:TRINITY_DN1492_c0_g1_i1.p1 TRINITY_DN1492_c0_g1~~TRINITY_DN1492_c0_g1_i1.p1  ORF type:complete len:224 (-),score=33.64 TRINITY_DN1492_c0_g1_i1:44-625(-)